MGRAATFNAATELALPLRALCAPPQLSLCTHHSFCFTQKVGSCASMDAHEISRNLKSLKNDDRTLKRWLSSTNASLFLHSRALSSPNVEFLRLRPQYQVFTESKSCLGSCSRKQGNTDSACHLPRYPARIKKIPQWWIYVPARRVLTRRESARACICVYILTILI
jgi:hypothetical protein